MSNVNDNYRIKDQRKPGTMWGPYMMSPIATKAKTPIIESLPEESEERKHLMATVNRIFQDREREAKKSLEQLQ